MSAQIPGSVPVAKGAVCYGLDKISKGPRARKRLTDLRRALRKLPSNRKGLAEIFDLYVLKFVFKETTRRQIVEHLNEFWFDPRSSRGYFKDVPVAKIYADGVIQALDLSLDRKGRPVQLDCWWTIDGSAGEIQLMSLTERDSGQTTSNTITLLIQTPRPKPISRAKPEPPWILGKAEAYVTRREGRSVTTKRVKSLR